MKFKYGKFLGRGVFVSSMMFLLSACEEEKPLRGARENILLSEEAGEGSVARDRSPVEIDAAVANTSFPQSGLNPSHSYPPLKLSVRSELARLWSAKLDFENTKSLKMIASPIMAENKVFCLDAGGMLYAFDARTGARLWRRSTTIVGKDGQIGAAMAYDSGRLVVSTCFAEAFCFNAKNGHMNWRIKLPSSCKGDAITISEGRVFMMCANSSLQVIDLDKGSTLWSHSGMASESVFLGSAAPAVANGVVYLAYPSGEIHALMVETGSPVWEALFPKFSLGSSAQAFTHPKASPVVKDGVAYFVAANEQIAAFDANSGKRLWIKDYGGIQTPIVNGNSVFLFNSGSEVLCLNRSNGALRWKVLLDKNDRYDWYGMILVKDHLLCISPTGKMSFVEAKTGRIRKVRELGTVAQVNPIVANSTLYILEDGGDLVAYK